MHDATMSLKPWEAAALGDLEALRESFRVYMDWDPEEAALWAVYGGNVACLELVHAHGGPMTEEVCNWAVEYGKVACLRYAHEHGAQLSERLWRWALACRKEECARFIREQLDTPVRKRKRSDE